MVSDLGVDQPLRRIQDEEGWKKVEEPLDKIRPMLGSHDVDEDEGMGMERGTKTRGY